MAPLLATRGAASSRGFGLARFLSSISTDFESIATVSLSTTSQATVTFTSIPDTYDHLQVRIFARSTYSGASDYMTITTPSNGTRYHFLNGDGNSATAVSSNYLKLAALMPGDTATTSTFCISVVDILDYKHTNKTKVGSAFSGYDANGSGRIGVFSFNIDTLSAITSLTFSSDNSASFARYSHFALYGIKGT